MVKAEFWDEVVDLGAILRKNDHHQGNLAHIRSIKLIRVIVPFPIGKSRLTTTHKIHFLPASPSHNPSVRCSSKLQPLSPLYLYKSHFLCPEDHSLVHLEKSSTSFISHPSPAFLLQSASQSATYTLSSARLEHHSSLYNGCLSIIADSVKGSTCLFPIGQRTIAFRGHVSLTFDL